MSALISLGYFRVLLVTPLVCLISHSRWAVLRLRWRVPDVASGAPH